MAEKDHPVQRFFGHWVGRHTVQLVIWGFFVGVAWATSQADIKSVQKEQTGTSKDVSDIKKSVNEIKIDAATTAEKVKNLEDLVKNLNSKVDTLIWRTAPGNPDSPYPR